MKKIYVAGEATLAHAEVLEIAREVPSGALGELTVMLSCIHPKVVQNRGGPDVKLLHRLFLAR